MFSLREGPRSNFTIKYIVKRPPNHLELVSINEGRTARSYLDANGTEFLQQDL